MREGIYKDKDAFDQQEVRQSPDVDPDRRVEVKSVETSDEGDVSAKIDPDLRVDVAKERIAYEIHTRNESLNGDRHPITGVSFERKTVEDADGNEVTGVFPVFDSEVDAQLPDELLQSSDREQFDECNKQLKEAVEKDPELAAKFTPEQLEQIMNGETPDGYTWHHNEEKGKMQLVDADIHAQTGHTGGKTIWGGGNGNR